MSLQSILEDIPKHDVLVVLGDFNARVGSDNTNRERIMGKHGTGTMTDNSFGILQEETEMTIHSFNMAMELAGKAVLGYRRAKKEQWISISTWDKIDQRKGIKKKLLTTKSPRLKERLSREYSQKDKEVKRSTRVNKCTYIENLAEDAEAAARRKDMKSLYQITKKLKGDTGPNQNLPLKDADGKIISREREDRKMEGAFPTGSQSCRSTQTCRHPGGSR